MSRYNINPESEILSLDTTKKVMQTLQIMQTAFSSMQLSKKEVTEKVCIAFSGGKDSIVIAYLANKYFGIRRGICEQSFCFPKDKEDFKKVATALNLDITFKESLNDNWLVGNSQYIFCDQKQASKFYLLRQQTSVRKYSEGANKYGIKFSVVLTGRRNQENSIRKDFYLRKNGILQAHPLRFWETKEVWSFIQQNNLPYPSIYTTDLGLAEGATPWCNINVEKAGGRDNCWRMIYLHDKDYFLNHIAKKYHEAAVWAKVERQSKGIFLP
jgi:3'-phosphoadenosine 5'-phosphosulfate sulfotransferase (PAPS reductase)/FAD synthetase